MHVCILVLLPYSRFIDKCGQISYTDLTKHIINMYKKILLT